MSERSIERLTWRQSESRRARRRQTPTRRRTYDGRPRDDATTATRGESDEGKNNPPGYADRAIGDERARDAKAGGEDRTGDMVLYEAMILVSARAPKSACADVLRRLGTSVMEKGGVVTNVTSYGARTLAYEFKRPGERHFEVGLRNVRNDATRIGRVF